jgi:phosphoribosylaminoimidazolecarboxamide formyltransferase/IMP cyclohydrolase
VSKTAKTHTATALVSVTDKEGLTELALALRDAGLAIIASSGTKTFLEEKGVEVREISDYTKSPEILGGRVKTLHPKIHGGILADRDNAEHVRTLEDQATQPIDVVVVNLYPFEEKARTGLSPDQLIEYIDIGGITLIRAAAKNHKHVTVLTHPSQYAAVVAELKSAGATSAKTRARLAAPPSRTRSAGHSLPTRSRSGSRSGCRRSPTSVMARTHTSGERFIERWSIRRWSI